MHLLHGIPSHTVGLHLPDLYLNKDLLVIVVALSGGGGRGAQMERLTEGAGAWERSAGSSRPLSSSSFNLIHSLKVNFVANHAGRLNREEGGRGRGQRLTIWRCRGEPNLLLPRLSEYLLFFHSLETTDSSTDVSGEVSEF